MSNTLDQTVRELELAPMHRLQVDATQTTAELLKQMANTAFTGRALGEAVDVMEAMLRDRAFVVMTLSGAMTMAGLSDLVIQAIERGWVNCIVATGALVGHGMTEDLGMPHFKAKPSISDEEYYTHGLNRVYDVIEPEANLDSMEQQIRGFFEELAQSRQEALGSAELLHFLGKRLGGHGILQSALKKNVPIFIPAFTDSELGLDFAVHAIRQRQNGQSALRFDGFRDLEQYAALCEQAARVKRKIGIFTIGGGVPRNWAQQIGPFVDIRKKRVGLDLAEVRFAYGVRMCPDPVHYGHLSGCTYSEGVSWGKFIPISQGGRFAEVLLDATVGWPLLTHALIQRGH